MQTVARICNKAMYMNHGKSLEYSTSVSQAIELYFKDFQGEKGSIQFNSGAEINRILLNNSNNDNTNPLRIKYLDSLEIELEITLKKEVPNFYIMYQITDKDMRIVGQYFTNFQYEYFDGSQKDHVIRTKFSSLQFIDGEYYITYFIAFSKGSQNNYEYLAIYRNFSKFQVYGINDTLYAVVHLQADVHQNNKQLKEKALYVE
jgi:hypothetical protein